MTEHRLRRLDTGEEFTLQGQVFIGRDEACDIVLADPEVSRRHAVISVTADGVVITDNESTNGIMVGGRSSHRAQLSHGQLLQIGKTLLCFLAQGQSDDPTIAMAPSGSQRASFAVDQGDGDETEVRAHFAPLPSDESNTQPDAPTPVFASDADKALLRRLLQHHALTKEQALAVFMPLKDEPGGLRRVATDRSPEWSLGRRNDCDLVFDHPSISGRHAQLSLTDGVWWLTDQDSRNGMYCNGQVVKRSALKPGDLIQLGAIELLFDVVDD